MIFETMSYFTSLQVEDDEKSTVNEKVLSVDFEIYLISRFSNTFWNEISFLSQSDTFQNNFTIIYV